MAYLDVRLSHCVAYGFTGGPRYSTLVVALDNGREQRNQQWEHPKHEYSATFLNLATVAQQKILAAFHVTAGQEHVFKFKDWNDYTARSLDGDWLPILAPVIGTSQPAQLVKSYIFGPMARGRPIQAPVAGTIVIYRNGIPVPVTVDYGTGLVTPLSPWVAGTYSWDGEHDVWVRFASDFNAFAIGAPNARTSDVQLVEVRR